MASWVVVYVVSTALVLHQYLLGWFLTLALRLGLRWFLSSRVAKQQQQQPPEFRLVGGDFLAKLHFLLPQHATQPWNVIAQVISLGLSSVRVSFPSTAQRLEVALQGCYASGQIQIARRAGEPSVATLRVHLSIDSIQISCLSRTPRTHASHDHPGLTKWARLAWFLPQCSVQGVTFRVDIDHTNDTGKLSSLETAFRLNQFSLCAEPPKPTIVAESTNEPIPVPDKEALKWVVNMEGISMVGATSLEGQGKNSASHEQTSSEDSSIQIQMNRFQALLRLEQHFKWHVQVNPMKEAEVSCEDQWGAILISAEASELEKALIIATALQCILEEIQPLLRKNSDKIKHEETQPRKEKKPSSFPPLQMASAVFGVRVCLFQSALKQPGIRQVRLEAETDLLLEFKQTIMEGNDSSKHHGDCHLHGSPEISALVRRALLTAFTGPNAGQSTRNIQIDSVSVTQTKHSVSLPLQERNSSSLWQNSPEDAEPHMASHLDCASVCEPNGGMRGVGASDVVQIEANVESIMLDQNATLAWEWSQILGPLGACMSRHTHNTQIIRKNHKATRRKTKKQQLKINLSCQRASLNLSGFGPNGLDQDFSGSSPPMAAARYEISLGPFEASIITRKDFTESLESRLSTRMRTQFKHGTLSATCFPHSTLPILSTAPEDEKCRPKLTTTVSIESSDVVVKLELDKIASRVSQVIQVAFGDTELYEHTPKRSSPDGTQTKRVSILKTCNANINVSEYPPRHGQTLRQRHVEIQTHGDTVDLIWSPVLPWLHVYLEQQIKKDLLLFEKMLVPPKHSEGPPKKNMGIALSTYIRTNQTKVSTRVIAGKGSILDIDIYELSVDVVEEPSRLWKKPSLCLEMGRTCVALNEFQQTALVVDHIVLNNHMRHATQEEVQTYLEHGPVGYRSDKTEDVMNFSCLSSDQIERDIHGRPLMEEFELVLDEVMTVRIPPVLHLGEVITDVLITDPAINQGSIVAGLKKKRKKSGKHQLMKIRANVAHADMALLESRDDDMSNGESVHEDDCLNRLRLYISEMDIAIDRTIPPSKVQAMIRELDEDKSRNYTYGPVIQGGDMHVSIDHVVCMLHPLGLATPLASVHHWTIDGPLFLAGLHPETDGLVDGRIMATPIGCHHCGNRKEPRKADCTKSCCCLYGVDMLSNGIPPKVFMNTRIVCENIDASYGDVLLRPMSKLLQIIQRLIPPPPVPEIESQARQPIMLGWWDNLRYWIHDKTDFRVQHLSFRWLLDKAKHVDYSLIASCENGLIQHQPGVFKILMTDFIVCVPGVSYQVAQTKEGSTERLLSFAKLSQRNHSINRHSLLLIPVLGLKCEFGWVVNEEYAVSSSEHHCPYLCSNFRTILDERKEHPMKMIRSKGWNLHLSFELLGDEDELWNWVALRIDVLPWLTHKNPELIPIPQSHGVPEDMPGPLPEIERFSMDAKCNALGVGTWYDQNASSGSTSTKNAGLYIRVPKLDAVIGGGHDKTISLRGPILVSSLDVNMQGRDLSSRSVDVGTRTIKLVEEVDRFASQFSAKQSWTEEVEFFRQKLEKRVHASKPSSEDTFDLLIGHTHNFSVENKPVENKHRIFQFLQQIKSELTDVNNLLSFENVDIVENSLERLKASNTTKPTNSKNNPMGSVERPSLSEFSRNHPIMHPSGLQNDKINQSSASAQVPSSSNDVEVNNSTWTVMASGMKLLWTLEIRDSLTSIVADLRYTINFMKVHSRTGEQPAQISNHEKVYDDDSSESKSMKNQRAASIDVNDEDFDVSNIRSSRSSETEVKSSLLYLLKQKSPSVSSTDDDVHGSSGGLNKSTLEKAEQGRLKKTSEIKVMSDQEEARNKTAPTFDIHLSNPQIQLHSRRTGGSIVIAVNGAYVEGREFVNIFTTRETALDAPLDTLLRKTEFTYMLDSLEMYAVGENVDISDNLHWIDLLSEDWETADNPLPEAPSASSIADYFGIQDERSDVFAKGLIIEPIASSNSEDVEVSLCVEDEINDSSDKVPPSNCFPEYLKHHEPRRFGPPRLLRKILEKSTFWSRQRYHRPPNDFSKNEIEQLIASGSILPLLDPLAEVKSPQMLKMNGTDLDFLELHIDELSFLLDAYQFRTTLDLIRNVILEPMEPPRNRGQDFASSTQDVLPTDIEPKKSDTHDSNRKKHMNEVLCQWQEEGAKQQKIKKTRDHLRHAAKELQLELEEEHLQVGETIIRHVEYSLGKAKWKVKSPEFVDEVEINMSDFYGTHDFEADGSVNTRLGLEDLHISSKKPGPEAINFPDPTVIVSTIMGVEMSPCQRCGHPFDRRLNESTSCSFHADRHGLPGKFHQNMSSTGESGSGRWSCCHALWEGAPGCRSRPHTGQERAVDIRVESMPRTVEGLTMYNHFEINIYPSVPHTMIVQMTKALGKLFIAYFMDGVTTSIDESDSNIRGSISKRESHTGNILAKTRDTEKDHWTPKKKASLLGVYDLKSSGSEHDQTSSTSSRSTRKSRKTPSASVDDSDSDTEGQSSMSTAPSGNTELVFIKYWRVGHINVDILLAGFSVIPENTNIQIVVPPFSKAYKVGTGNYLGYKYLSHLIHEVVKSAASSSLGRVRERIMGPPAYDSKTYICPKPIDRSIQNSDRSGNESLAFVETMESRDTFLSEGDSERVGMFLLGTPMKRSRTYSRGHRSRTTTM